MAVCFGRDFVKNGDAWRVTDRHDDGSLVVKHQSHGGRAILHSDYVQTHVELGYATTAHRAQGSTVDTAHPLITEEMARENLYVIATRAREYTRLYVATHQVPDLDPDDHLDRVRIDTNAYAAREILERVITRESADLSATETIRKAQGDAVNLSVLISNYQHAHQVLTAHATLPKASDYQHAHDILARVQLPAWLPVVPTQGSLLDDEHAYLQSSAELIHVRIEELTEHAIAHRPAWTSKLGNEPVHAEERAAWAARVGILAAYREQRQVGDNDPHHPAGPHVETNHVDYEAYSHAFRAAAELRQVARGRPWHEIDPNLPQRPDAPKLENVRAPSGDGHARARERRRESLTPAQRQRIADAVAQLRTRQVREYEQQPGQRQEIPELRPLLTPPEPQPQYGHGPEIGW